MGSGKELRNELDRVWKVLKRHNEWLHSGRQLARFEQFFQRKMEVLRQPLSLIGMHLALCVDTRDPLGQNRVKYFSPVLDIPITGGQAIVNAEFDGNNLVGDEVSVVTKVTELDWAWPVSAAGGFDDSGLSWIPPAGSMLCIIFQHGNPGTAFYFGTTWNRDRGPVGQHADIWDYDIPEYNKIFELHRGGYMVGPNDESQVFPPENTDNYQAFDIDAQLDENVVAGVFTERTYPHQYILRTPEKAHLKFDDGDPRCNRRYKRTELMSSLGQIFLMKDDPYHHCGAWLNPQCQISYISVIPSICEGLTSIVTATTDEGLVISNIVAVPYPCEQGPENCPTLPSQVPSFTVEQEYLGIEHLCPPPSPFPSLDTMPAECMGVLHGLTDFCFNFNNQGENKYQKHRQECYPYYCNKCGLPQSGIQIQSRSMHAIIMDDSVEQPRQRPEWEITNKPFDYDGCTGNFKGRLIIRSATDHFMEFNDTEDQPKIRGPKNGITIATATGNSICMNDHSKPRNNDPDDHDCFAGENRGIFITSTSKHALEMSDNGNVQCSNERAGCSKPGAYANRAFVRLRSGYGVGITLADNYDQTKTDQQYLQLLSPQKDNLTRGPHMMHMQERAQGPGQIFLRAGGDYIVQTYDEMVEVVGDEKDNPSDKMEFISKRKILSVKDTYYNKAKTHVFWADDYIFLLAGKDCEDDDGNGEPCAFPVCVATQPIPEYISAATGIKASERIFATALPRPSDPCEGIASE